MSAAVRDVLCEESENESVQSKQQKKGFPAKACMNHPDKPCCGNCVKCHCALTSESKAEKDNPVVD